MKKNQQATRYKKDDLVNITEPAVKIKQTEDIGYIIDDKGEFEFFRADKNGNELELDTYTDGLADSIISTLFPLMSFRDVLSKQVDENDEPHPLFFLLDELLEIATNQIQELCRVLEDQFGKMEIYRCQVGAGGIREGAFLYASKEASKKAA